jgi:xanthine dehydrogenase accessory factor
MNLSELTALNRARHARQAALQLTDLSTGESRIILEDEIYGGSLDAALFERLRSGKSGASEIEGRSVFVNVHLPPVRIVVIGAVHISQALFGMAALAGFDIHIIDPRTAFATAERFEGARLSADWPIDVLAEVPLDRHSALVAVTHDPKIDDYPLGQALRAGCFYVGALGSRKTHAARVERLKREGFGEDEIARIRAPIGLPIGAANPAEIAVSILAEIVQARRMTERGSP